MISNAVTLLKIFSYCVYLLFCTNRDNREKKIPALLFKLGPTFVKFGQSLSSRSDIIGDKMAQSLETLCDDMPHFDFKHVKSTIESELHCKINDIFMEFCEKPVAAASIAQVHKAKTLNGTPVAVKVLRPNIEKQFKKDIQLLTFIGNILKHLVAQRLKPHETIKTFRESSKFELDLRFEAANCNELSDNISIGSKFRTPDVHWNLTSQRVLTMQWIEKIPLSEIKNKKEVARNIAIMFFQQAYNDGFFHADMHPGNILVDNNDTVHMVDFGIMGRLDLKTKIYVAEILRGFLNRDYQHIANIHYIAGYVSPEHTNFITACRALGEPIIGKASSEISVGKLLLQLFNVTSDFDMEVQPQLLLLQKTTVLLEGLCSKIDPEINLWETFKPYMDEWARQNLTLRNKICNITTLNAMYSIPSLIKRFKQIVNTKEKTNNVSLLKVALIIFTIALLIQYL